MVRDRPAAIWSPPARADLSEIWRYHAEAAGAQVADKLLRTIGETCKILEQHPLAGRARNEIRLNLRSIPANPYVVFYRIGAGTVEIVRVLHGSRDIDEIFTE